MSNFVPLSEKVVAALEILGEFSFVVQTDNRRSLRVF
jgi:hypothetical protein